MKKEPKELPKLSDEELAKARGGAAAVTPCRCACSGACAPCT